MKKILLMICLLTAPLNANDLLKEYGKVLLKTGSYAGGAALIVCGLYEMRHHIEAVHTGFCASKKALREFLDDKPTLKMLGKWSLPVIALATGFFLILKADSIEIK